MRLLKPSFWIGLVTGLIILFLSQSQIASNFENHIFDQFTKWTADQKKWPDQIVLVLIDDPSLQKLGLKYGWQWPWPRSAHAASIAYLKKAGAKAIAFDILFPEVSPDILEDDLFAAYIQSAGNIWLVTKPAKDGSSTDLIPTLKSAAEKNIALVSIEKDPDGVIRRYPAKNLWDESKQKPLALGLAQLLKKSWNGEEGQILLRWYGQSSELSKNQVVSASLIVALTRENLDVMVKQKKSKFKGFDEVDPKHVSELIQDFPVLPGMEFFSDKIIFIGCSGAGTFDAVATPISSYETGVMTHATALANLIRGDYLRLTPLWIRLGFILFASFLVTLTCTISRFIYRQIIFTILVLAGIAICSFVLFNQNFWLPPLFAVLGGIASFTAIMTYNYFVEGKQRRQLKQLFSDFVSPDVLAEIQNDPKGINLHGDRRMGTVLFCDLAGFTTFTESSPPEQLMDAINSYLAEASKILLAHGAYVDKFIGDAVMAVFSVPKPQANHAVEACLAALELQKMMVTLNQSLHQKYQLHQLDLRTGINTGEMIAGPMGYARKLNYSVLGDTVNLASRLEGANKAYDTRIMIGPETYELVKEDVETRILDYLRVKGKHQPVRVYELMAQKGGLDTNQTQMKTIYQEGIDLYQKRSWPEAKKCFEKALKILPEDGPSRIYLERSKHYLRHPPPDDWDGSFGLDSK